MHLVIRLLSHFKYNVKAEILCFLTVFCKINLRLGANKFDFSTKFFRTFKFM